LAGATEKMAAAWRGAAARTGREDKDKWSDVSEPSS
jgi:hypothetical protein